MREKRICLCNFCYERDKNKSVHCLEPKDNSLPRKLPHKSNFNPPDDEPRPHFLTLQEWEALKGESIKLKHDLTLQAALPKLEGLKKLLGNQELPGIQELPGLQALPDPCALNLGTSNAGPSNHHQDDGQPEQNQHDHHGIVGDDCVVHDADDECMNHDAEADGTIFTDDLQALHGVFPGFDGGKLSTDRECRKFPDVERLLEGKVLHDLVKKYCYQLMWNKVVHKMTVAQVESQLQTTAELARRECLEHDKPCPWYPCTYPQLMAVVFGPDDGCKLGNEVIYDVCATCYTVYRGLEEVHTPASTCRKCASPREGCLKYHYRQVVSLW